MLGLDQVLARDIERIIDHEWDSVGLCIQSAATASVAFVSTPAN